MRTYDAIQTALPGTKGDVEYLRILHAAASTFEADVEQSLAALVLEASGSAPIDQSRAAPHSLPLRAVQPGPDWKIGAGSLGTSGMR